jgi:hypothetical protein
MGRTADGAKQSRYRKRFIEYPGLFLFIIYFPAPGLLFAIATTAQKGRDLWVSAIVFCPGCYCRDSLE